MDTSQTQALPLESDAAPAPTLPPPAVLSQEKGLAAKDQKGAQEQEAEAKPSAGEMSTLVLMQAGLTVFDAILLVMLFVMWQIDAEAIASVLRSATGWAFLLALAPVAGGVFLLHRNKQAEAHKGGLGWARAGIYAGTLLATAILVIPAIVTLRSIVSIEMR